MRSRNFNQGAFSTNKWGSLRYFPPLHNVKESFENTPNSHLCYKPRQNLMVSGSRQSTIKQTEYKTQGDLCRLILEDFTHQLHFKIALGWILVMFLKWKTTWQSLDSDWLTWKHSVYHLFHFILVSHIKQVRESHTAMLNVGPQDRQALIIFGHLMKTIHWWLTGWENKGLIDHWWK